MRIKFHIAIVVLLCSLGGLGLSVGLIVAYRGLDNDVREWGPDSLARRDLSRIETLVDEMDSSL